MTPIDQPLTPVARRGDEHDKKGAANVPARPTVQGIHSHLDDILLKGQKWEAQIGHALISGNLVRTVHGASSITLSVNDPGRKLMNSELLKAKFNVAIDGLGFRYVGFSSGGRGEPLELRFEALAVARLRERHGPHKAFRDEVTRAEFAKSLVSELRPPLRFISPELHVKQPVVKNLRESRARTQDAAEERGKGLGAGANVKCKGQTPTQGQRELGEMALRIADEVAAPFRVQVALIEALIDETDMGLVQRWNVLAALEPYTKERNAADEIRGFLTNSPTWTGYPNGAIGWFKNHPSDPPHVIAQGIQKSATSDGSNYAQFYDESKHWVESFTGTTEGASEGTTGAAAGVPIRYAFEEKEEEDHWTCLQRLADEVKWDCFESAAWIYFLPERDLFSSMVRMIVGPNVPGIEDTAVSHDVGKRFTEITAQVRADAWAAPPGSMAEVKEHGAADGHYLVDTIEAPMRSRNAVCTVKLRKRIKALPEPAPSTKTPSSNSGINPTFGGTVGSGEMGVYAGTAEDVVNEVIDYAHVNGFPAVTRETVRAANAVHGPTVSGGRSDHQGPPATAWAADISNGTTTPEEDHLAKAISVAFGIPWSGSGLVTHEAHGYRLQLIYRTLEGGDHYNHVHFGAEVK